MSMDIVRRVADELGQNRFSGELNLGENGDALLNPDLRQAVSYIVQAAPLAKIILYTNMMHLDPELAEFLLRHNLSRLHCNIDGASKNTYEAAKPGLRFETVKENLHYFLSLRDKLASPCTVRIWILSPKVYLEAKTKEPTDLPYDVPEIKAYWLKFLSPRDEIGEFGSANILSWNLPSGKRERRQKCPPVIVQDILRKLFISTEGDVYVCCTDYNTHLTYGNVMDQSLYDLWSSERHKEIIRNILNGDYEHVGIPCVTCAE
jgi:MoaA/NifB/PqqE/SkfB family radical SAM enzyme